MAALILTAGVFADVHGRKKTCQVALALCAAGALVALCARSIPLVRAGEAGGLGAVAGLDLGAPQPGPPWPPCRARSSTACGSASASRRSCW
ncbi:hypothetical protein GCM10027203_64190 [Nonomuraea fastidiosa]